MLWKNSSQQYGLLTKFLHWSVAILILFLIWLGWFMVDLSYYDAWYQDSLLLHKALGIVVMILASIKVVWTLFTGLPNPVNTLTSLEVWSSKIMHYLLFIMMLVIPISGYLISTSKSDPISMFGLFDFPALIVLSKTWLDITIATHFYAAYITLVLAGVHALAALKHHFISKDETLRRMV